jgi:hypothetical protein
MHPSNTDLQGAQDIMGVRNNAESNDYGKTKLNEA